jgi:uncharacterized membrane protein YhaH (DUF805 family)
VYCRAWIHPAREKENLNMHGTAPERPMTFIEAVRICFIKYAVFHGCASRPEFWWFALFNFVGAVALQVIDDNLALAFTIATLLPFAAVTTRRLHDTDKSGWLQLIGIIPIAGWILLIVWCAQEGKPNRYGASANPHF